MNPADALTKPISVTHLKVWQWGPPFLLQDEESWPVIPEENSESVLRDPEEIQEKTCKRRKMKTASVHAIQNESSEDTDDTEQQRENISESTY